MRALSRRSGFTLIEMAIAMGIAGIVLFAVATIVSQSNTAYTTVNEDTDANFSLRQTLARIADDLRQSDPTVIFVTPGTDYDSVDLQTPVSYAGSTVSWGASGTAGWHIHYLVDTTSGNSWLVRRVTDAAGNLMAVDQVMAHSVDTAFGGVKGFSVTANNGLYTIALRVTANRGTYVWRRSETTSASVRN